MFIRYRKIENTLCVVALCKEHLGSIPTTKIYTYCQVESK